MRTGTAYRIRTGDLRLERAVSWASRRMRRRGVGARVDRHPRQHRPKRTTALVRLLAEQVLDPEDVGDREVAMVPLELLRQRRPADPAAAVNVRHLAQLVRLDRVPERRRELGREED